MKRRERSIRGSDAEEGVQPGNARRLQDAAAALQKRTGQTEEKQQCHTVSGPGRESQLAQLLSVCIHSFLPSCRVLPSELAPTPAAVDGLRTGGGANGAAKKGGGGAA